jgi:hypothetical protein
VILCADAFTHCAPVYLRTCLFALSQFISIIQYMNTYQGIYIRAVRFQKFYLGFGFFGTKKPRFGFGCMNSFMYVSSIFTK